ncbi:MAG: NUDIX hydrolase [Candidatus Edwardsbacteria bacterium]|nr:NUDIX hydrolase [Candidatus Edwardsbacteria bacterium]
MNRPRDRHGWRTTGARTVYRNRWLALREYRIAYPGGRPGIYGMVHKPPGVAYTVGRDFLELPAGAISRRETPLAAARRELFEETGLRAKRWARLGSFFTALGHEDAEIIVYLARDLDDSALSHANKEHDEGILGIYALPIIRVKRLVKTDRINCGITLASLHLFFSHQGK